MLYLYDQILYIPLLNTLIFLYNTIALHDLGLAIIFLTILIRLILFPVFHKSAQHQALAQRLQPEIKRLQELHKGDREKQTRAIMDLHKEHGTSPFSGFLLLIVQIPIMIVLFQIFKASLTPEFFDGLYSFIRRPETIETTFLGLINLKDTNILIVGLVALAQYFQGKMSLAKQNPGQLSPAEKASRHMIFIGPAITLVVFYSLSAAVNLYFLVSSLFSLLQQAIVNKKMDHGPVRSRDRSQKPKALTPPQ
ncbi:MAG: YidC/Oxa1 family membrane protein insertase [bacterium]|nr:YidC/Oxa1 family membrane protein insertase [bacterium]